jgi:uncharacterized protein YcbK (DUF882 family)
MCFFSKTPKKEKVKLRHFKLDEFDSPDEKGSGKKMDKTFLLFLDELRHRCNFKFFITSGFRTKSHHEDLTKRGYKTIKNSAHLEGKAVDVIISDSYKRALFVAFALELASELDLPFRLGIAGKDKGNFIHIDISEKLSSPKIWIY